MLRLLAEMSWRWIGKRSKKLPAPAPRSNVTGWYLGCSPLRCHSVMSDRSHFRSSLARSKSCLHAAWYLRTNEFRFSYKRQAEHTAPAWRHRWQLAGTGRRRAGRGLEGALVCRHCIEHGTLLYRGRNLRQKVYIRCPLWAPRVTDPGLSRVACSGSVPLRI